jgi:hypothetical protein
VVWFGEVLSCRLLTLLRNSAGERRVSLPRPGRQQLVHDLLVSSTVRQSKRSLPTLYHPPLEASSVSRVPSDGRHGERAKRRAGRVDVHTSFCMFTDAPAASSLSTITM